MSTITTRSGKGSPLTNNEVDANFTNLNNDKLESGDLSVVTTAVGTAALAYNSGVFTYTPPDLTNIDLSLYAPLAGAVFTGNVEAPLFEGDLTGAILFKGSAGEALTKGDPVYISGISGNKTVVSKADANDANKMPCFGIVDDTVSLNADCSVVTFGTLQGLDTSSFSEGDELYISDTGTLTTTAPTGEASQIQKIGKVTRSHASAGSIKVMGAGRTNATPNLNDGNFFLGNSSNQAVSADFTTAVRGEISAGTGIGLSGGVISNTAPDQTVALTGGTGISTSGTYPSFTITNDSPDQTVALTGAGATSISGTYPNFTITSTDTTYSLPLSSSSTRGGVKVGYSENGKNYPVELSSEKMYVNVPWTDSDTTYSAGTGITLTGTTFSLTDTNAKLNLSGGTLTGDLSVEGALTGTIVDSGDVTMMTLHHDVGSDLSTQKSFIDFSFEDDNTNETPQVRIGAVVGQNTNADTQLKEGSGAFVVYTNNAESTSGDAGASLTEKFRVDYVGNTTVSGTITATDGNSTNWNTAYGWGNHAGLYLPLAGGTMTGKISMFQNNDIFGLSGTIANYPRLSFYSSEGTHAAKTQTLSGDLIGQIDFNPHTGSSYTGGGKISFISTEAITSSQRGTEARIYSTKTGQSSLSYHQFKDDNLYIKNVGGATHKYWHAGNDGGGSGLDADLLDGQHGSYYAPASHVHSYLPLSGGTLTGNLVVEDSEVHVGDISADSWTRIKHAQADGYGFDFEHNNATVLINEQGSTNEALVLGDVDANNTHSGLFGISHTGNSGTTWTKKLDLRGDGDLYVGSSAQNKVWHEGTLTTTNKSNYDTAYGWGNHASAGYYPASNPNGYTNDQTAAEILTAIKTVDGSGSGLDADSVDGYHADRFFRRQGKANATVGGGWMTVATCTSGRRHGEVIVTDADSGDHAFIRIDWMRSYADSNFSVINCGGHQNRITGARVLNQTSDTTYGEKILQVYVTVSSNYEVNIYELGDIDDFTELTVVTPVIENTKTGYAVQGNELTGLDLVSLAAEEGIKAGGVVYAGGGLDVTGTATMDGLTVTSGSSSDNIVQVFGGGTIYAGLGVDGTGAVLTAGSSGSADSDLIIKTSSSGTEKQRARFQDNGDISFYEDTGTTAKLFWDASAESLGIGTSSPSSLLDLTTAGSTSLNIQGGDGNSKNIVFRKTTGGAQQAKISTVGDDLRFTTGPTAERMRIDSSGNLLINKTSNNPSSQGCQLSPNGTINSTVDIPTLSGGIQVRNNSSADSLTALRCFNGLADITTTGATGGGHSLSISGGQSGEYARFTNTKRLGISTSSPAEALHVVGNIVATGNITAYYSDERLKDLKGTIPNALDKVNQLNGYYYTPNETAQSLGVDNKGLEVGISAQEVEAVLPEVVTKSAIGDDYKTVWYEKLTPLLIEAVKELTEKVDKLEARLTELEK